ncbi:DegT/DnrJ/EryC1/StrS family aminotransferase [Ferrovibrio xuzhouensis]|uniref:DegT/DnrJ/EryC1/StrS family aminotransferase n=1 Tax=Ferrovibrio xuzhouensis TaxID=1576914 RepID=A0ABV7VKE2_9PROT
MSVPFFDIGPTHAEIAGEMDRAWHAVLDHRHFIMGERLAAFEAEFAAYCDTAHAIGVANGLDALTLILDGLGIGPGDEVIVPAHTFIATWLAVSRVGARPVPVDCEAATCNIDPAAVGAAVTGRTRAVIAVHLYGMPAAMAPLQQLCTAHGLHLIEDAAQAHGATGQGRRTGSLGIAAGFSFYPTKNLGALGDGGAVVTSDDALAARVRLLRNYGSERKYEHLVAGYNSRLDELQAALLSIKLRQLDRLNDQRRQIATRYQSGLAGLPDVTLPAVPDDYAPVWHLYTIRHPRRDAMMQSLAAAGIQTLIHYPAPPHLQPAYAALGYAAGAFPVAEAIARTTLSLPIWPGMSTEQVDAVIAAVTTAAHQDSNKVKTA